MLTKESKIKEMIKSREMHLTLYKGFKDKRPFHAFILINGTELKTIESCKTAVVLGEHAEVLYSDFGHEAPEYITKAVISGFCKRFNLDPILTGNPTSGDETYRNTASPQNRMRTGTSAKNEEGAGLPVIQGHPPAFWGVFQKVCQASLTSDILTI